MSRVVCAIVEAGADPARNPLLQGLGAHLAEAGVVLHRWDPSGSLRLPADPPVADLHLLKGDDPLVLVGGAAVVQRGGRCLNDLEATATVADKVVTQQLLAAAGLPVPRSVAVSTTEALAAALVDGPCFVKPTRGAHGHGVARLGPGEAERASPGPWLVQEAVPGDGAICKLYGVGRRVAVRRARTVAGRFDVERTPVPAPPARLVEAAVAAAELLGLVCFGADFVEGPDGPVLIDLNAFPGYRSVPEGPAWVARAVMDELEDR